MMYDNDDFYYAFFSLFNARLNERARAIRNFDR